MSEEYYFDYLILGGEYDRHVANGPRRDVLEIPVRKPMRMAKSYAAHVKADVTEPEVVEYKVIDHRTEDGRHFFIASNDDLSEVDVDQAIRESGIEAIS